MRPPKGLFPVVVVGTLFCELYSGKDGIANLGLLDPACDEMAFPLVGTRLMLAKAPPVPLLEPPTPPLPLDDVGLI